MVSAFFHPDAMNRLAERGGNGPIFKDIRRSEGGPGDCDDLAFLAGARHKVAVEHALAYSYQRYRLP